MIRRTELSDLQQFIPNKFSDLDNYTIFEDEDYYFYTVFDNGVKAILCFKEVSIGEWIIFLLASNDFTFKSAKIIKKFIYNGLEKIKPDRLITVSRQEEVIKRWHEFLGMTIEKEVEINNIKYDYWVLEWAGKH